MPYTEGSIYHIVVEIPDEDENILQSDEAKEDKNHEIWSMENESEEDTALDRVEAGEHLTEEQLEDLIQPNND